MKTWIFSFIRIQAKLAEKTYRTCQKHKFLSLLTGPPLLDFELISLQPNVSAALTKQNTTENSVTYNNNNQPSQDMTALQPKIFLTGTHQLLVKKNEVLPPPYETTAQFKSHLLSSVRKNCKLVFSRSRLIIFQVSLSYWYFSGFPHQCCIGRFQVSAAV